MRSGQEGSFWSEGQLRALLFLLGGISGDLLGQIIPIVTLWAHRGRGGVSLAPLPRLQQAAVT